MSDKTEKTEYIDPYKKAEFEAFIKTIKQGQVAHWVEIASALGVDKDTILKWKKLPQAQAAITEGIEHAIAQMQTAGAKDWRMWEAKLKMLGINPATNVDLKSGGEPLKIALVRFLGDGPEEPTDN